MEFSWEIGWCLTLLVGAVVLFVWEKLPPDLTALLILGGLLLPGILTPQEAFSVFSNEAPLTVAAMFVLSHALLRTGGLDVIAHFLGKASGGGEARSLIVIFVLAGLSSAFINNTPVVAVMMPVVMRHARNHNIPVSQLLIPLSYAAVLGGLCTLIGTSTNLVVHGIMRSRGMEGFTMFELAKVGIPLVLAGCVYVVIFAPKLLPRRETLTTLLAPELRKPQLVQILIPRESPLVGTELREIPWLTDPHHAGVRILEVRRRGGRLFSDLSVIQLEELDRLTLAVPQDAVRSEGGQFKTTLKGKSEDDLGFETLTTVDGRIVEAVVAPHSEWHNESIRELRPRTRLGVVVLAVHRDGRNLTSSFADQHLKSGDTLLLLGSNSAIEEASRDDESLLLLEPHEEPDLEPHPAGWAGPLAAGLIVAVVLAASLEWLPISVAAFGACLVLMLTRIVEPREAYRAIDWQILAIIFGTLSLGIAMEKTGTAEWLASHSVQSLGSFVAPAMMPMALLVFFVIVTSIFTEFASNNGAAALMAPLAIETARHLDLSPMPFLVAVTLAASAAFATPIGYQTNTMVYGAGGYSFKDFLRMGSPLNVITWIIMIVLIPLIWKF